MTPASGRTLLVLGNPRRSVQRWRVDVAVENLRPGDVLVMSGRGEAPAMAADAASRCGVDAARIVIEDAATTTWQNVQFSAPLIASGGEVLMISDPLHARRAASYWRDVVPGRAGELRRADLGSVWRRPVLLLGSVVYEVALRLRRYRPG